MTTSIDFLHRVDARNGNAEWVSTSVAQLRAATFLDGRETFFSNARVETTTYRSAAGATPPHMIFHVGFCGSTLLARLLDRPGSALVLKEPQALADLASQAPHLADAAVREALGWAIPHLAAAAPAGEVCIIKPSNWINGLAPALCRSGHVGRAVFLTMAPRAFLRAAFRGGRDRLGHCLRLAELLAQSVTGGPALVQAAIARANEPLDRAALLVMLAHRFQLQLFDVAEAMLPAGHALRLDHAELSAEPQIAANRVAALINVPLDVRSDFQTQLHSKDVSRRYSADAEQRANSDIEHEHGARFDRALAWFQHVNDAASQ